MSHRTLSPSVVRGKHDKDGRQACLIDAATEVFAKNGFDAATTREVAERAGCSEGLIHRYFGGKRGLLLAILADKGASVVTTSADALPWCDSVSDEIEQMLVWSLDAFWEQRDFMRVSVARSAIDREVGLVIGEHLHGNKVRFFAERLREHQARGSIRGDVDVESVALALAGLNIATGFFGQVAFEMDRGSVRAHVLEMARVITRGITAGFDAGSEPDAPPVIIAQAGRRAVS